jgi:spore maturation protein CgeB
LPGAGYDTFRFWENAACNAVHLSASSPLCIPYDFADGTQILRFGDVESLRRALDHALSNPRQSQEMAERGREHLACHHLTEHRAAYLIDKVRAALG